MQKEAKTFQNFVKIFFEIFRKISHQSVSQKKCVIETFRIYCETIPPFHWKPHLQSCTFRNWISLTLKLCQLCYSLSFGMRNWDSYVGISELPELRGHSFWDHTIGHPAYWRNYFREAAGIHFLATTQYRPLRSLL